MANDNGDSGSSVIEESETVSDDSGNVKSVPDESFADQEIDGDGFDDFSDTDSQEDNFSEGFAEGDYSESSEGE